MRTPRGAVLCAVTGAILALVLPAAPAMAASGDGVPDSGEFVLWYGSGFGLPLYDDADSGTYAGRYFVNSLVELDNAASSVANFTDNLAVRAYANEYWTGPSLPVARHGQVVAGVTWYYESLGAYDDALSGHRFIE
jgi:hypothetical protein